MHAIPRHLQHAVRQSLSFMPIVAIAGARQVGKSTLAHLSLENATSFFSLDDPSLLAAAKADPISFLERRNGVMAIDEVQRAPELFRALKLIVDQNHKAPGQFLLTGSANLMTLPNLGDSLAGRMEVLDLYPFAQSELAQGRPDFLVQAFAEKPEFSFSPLTQEDLIKHVLTGGYPDAVRLEEANRIRWHRAYVKSLIERDIKDLSEVFKLAELEKLLAVLCRHSAHEIVPASLAQHVQLDQKTVAKYITALERIYLIKQIPAWHRNDLKKIVKKAKLHFLDSGLLASMQRITVAKMLEDRNLLGPLLETFVCTELLKIAQCTEIDGLQETFNLHHYRDTQQHEVDLVIENSAGDAIGIEVKATQTASDALFKGLRKLAEYTPLKAGYVIYTGSQFLSFGHRMYAVPVAALMG